MVQLLRANHYTPHLNEIGRKTFFHRLEQKWIQGEHLLLAGPTGTGKTTVAHCLLDYQDDVVVLAVKPKDETLDRFKEGHLYGRREFKVIKSWPPDFVIRRVILWIKPKSINDTTEQAKKIYKALNDMYRSGGWCIYFDEAGYTAGSLGLAQALGVLLNQGRSSKISVAATVTRPRSMIARVPVEALNQCRHLIIFKYVDENEIDACAKIAGINKHLMFAYMQSLEYHRAEDGTEYSDFLYISHNQVVIVRNKGE
jgi:energy-coupling factor transporter ATP-binding protein EcfA2